MQRDFHVGNHVLHVAGDEFKAVPRDAFLKKIRNEEGRVHALVPRAAARHHELSRREEQGGAIRRVQAHCDGGEFALIVKREWKHLLNAVKIQSGNGRQDLRGCHDVVDNGQRRAILQQRRI